MFFFTSHPHLPQKPTLQINSNFTEIHKHFGTFCKDSLEFWEGSIGVGGGGGVVQRVRSNLLN